VLNFITCFQDADARLTAQLKAKLVTLLGTSISKLAMLCTFPGQKNEALKESHLLESLLHDLSCQLVRAISIENLDCFLVVGHIDCSTYAADQENQRADDYVERSRISCTTDSLLYRRSDSQ